jgi:hypothetical protein
VNSSALSCTPELYRRKQTGRLKIRLAINNCVSLESNKPAKPDSSNNTKVLPSVNKTTKPAEVPGGSRKVASILVHAAVLAHSGF